MELAHQRNYLLEKTWYCGEEGITLWTCISFPIH